MNVNHNHIALSILAGFILVAGAIYLKFAPSDVSIAAVAETNVQEEYLDVNPDELIRTENRHMYGNENAKITIVEFSDFECPFCERLNPTLKKLVDESNGEIVWEYRHLPLPMHSRAMPAAIVSECVARELGNEAFWQFSDTVFTNIGKYDEEAIKDVAIKLGLTKSTVDNCFADEAINQAIADDMTVARNLGGSGTPFSLIIREDKKVIPVVGALPYEFWVSKLDL